MNKIKALVLMQLKDKINIKFGNKRSVLTKILLECFKTILVTAIAYVFFMLSNLFSIFSMYKQIPLSVMTIIMVFILLLSTISCTTGLKNTLYKSEDNKFLVTYPISGNKIFLSKIIVFYIFELRRSLTFSIPIFLAYGIISGLNFFFYIWVFIAFFIISAFPVLLGCMLSIPALYLDRFLSKFKLIKSLLLISIIAAAMYGIIYLINMIPEEFNMVYAWPSIFRTIQLVLERFQKYLYPVYLLVTSVTGWPVSLSFTYLSYIPWVTMLAFIAILGLMFCTIYFGVKKHYISMSSKSFEFAKSTTVKVKPNKKHNRLVSYAIEEIKDLTRSGDYILGFFATYIIVPIMILFLTKLFGSLIIRYYGEMLSWVFVILLIILPLTAANSNLAAIYSREGRASLMTKTFPDNPLFPLLNKLFLFIICTIISTSSCIYIFQAYAHLDILTMVFIGLGIILFEIGMIFYAGYLDLKNPQNDQFATNSGNFVNPNEINFIVVSFLLSGIIAFYSYILIMENSGNFIVFGVKLFFIGLLIATIMFVLYYTQIKAFYYDAAEGKR
ncbi:MAG: hypothetical protein RR734_03360 [Bacilli bacterium]